jgi:2-polyprenyl-6-methoxyphenol hydroxylase-like FAD-dependent oxidoreductase
MGSGLSPFPYGLVYPQDEHERLLIDQLAKAGVQVERQTELVAFEQTSGSVRARLRRADGATNACEATYLAACDGAHSAVREGLASERSVRSVGLVGRGGERSTCRGSAAAAHAPPVNLRKSRLL